QLAEGRMLFEAVAGEVNRIHQPARRAEFAAQYRLRTAEYKTTGVANSLLDLPKLDFAKASRRSANHRQRLAVRRERERLHAFGKADEARQQPRTIRLVDKYFMVARNRKQIAVGRELH